MLRNIRRRLGRYIEGYVDDWKRNPNRIGTLDSYLLLQLHEVRLLIFPLTNYFVL